MLKGRFFIDFLYCTSTTLKIIESKSEIFLQNENLKNYIEIIKMLKELNSLNSQNALTSKRSKLLLIRSFVIIRVCTWLHTYFLSNMHGLWTPNEAFFHWNPKPLDFSRQFGLIIFLALEAFSVDLSGPILLLWVLCPFFSLISRYFWNNWAFISKSQIFIWDLNLGHKELGK